MSGSTNDAKRRTVAPPQPLQERKRTGVTLSLTPPPNPLAAAPVNLLPPSAFLEQAIQDCKRCSDIVSSDRVTLNILGLAKFYPGNRRRLLNVFRQRIQEVSTSGYDDALYVTYQDMVVMMQDWYFANDLRAIINETLGELQRGELAPRLLSRTPLLQENTSLRQTIETQRADYQRELKQKDEQIDKLVGQLETAVTELREARQDILKWKQEKEPSSPYEQKQDYSS